MYRVAICDDEPEVCTVMAEILDRASGLPELEITTYYEGETLCETVRRGMPFDLYILDIELPCINGVEVGQKLRNELGQEYAQLLRFLYKGIIIKHNKTEPTYTKTSLFLCEKRRFFMARTEKGVVTTI